MCAKYRENCLRRSGSKLDLTKSDRNQVEYKIKIKTDAFRCETIYSRDIGNQKRETVIFYFIKMFIFCTHYLLKKLDLLIKGK